MLDMLGLASRFSRVSDLDYYYKNRVDSFVYLVTMKRSTMLAVVYDYFLKSEPRLIEYAKEIVRSKKM